MHVERGEKSGTGVPHVVHGDPADARLVAACLETTVQVPRLERRTGPGREHQPVLDPGDASRSRHGGLVLLADPQCRYADARHRQGQRGGRTWTTETVLARGTPISVAAACALATSPGSNRHTTSSSHQSPCTTHTRHSNPYLFPELIPVVLPVQRANAPNIPRIARIWARAAPQCQGCPRSGYTAARSGKARVTAAVRLETNGTPAANTRPGSSAKPKPAWRPLSKRKPGMKPEIEL